jgi:hypothetical protein
MMFHTALPEMLAGLPRRSLKPVRAFLVLEKNPRDKKAAKVVIIRKSNRLFLMWH